MLYGAELSHYLRWKKQVTRSTSSSNCISEPLYSLSQSATISFCTHTQNRMYGEWSRYVSERSHTLAPHTAMSMPLAVWCTVTQLAFAVCLYVKGCEFQTAFSSFHNSTAGCTAMSRHLTFSQLSVRHVCVCFCLDIKQLWWFPWKKKCPHRLTYLNTWSLVGSAALIVMEPLDVEPWWRKYVTDNGL